MADDRHPFFPPPAELQAEIPQRLARLEGRRQFRFRMHMDIPLEMALGTNRFGAIARQVLRVDERGHLARHRARCFPGVEFHMDRSRTMAAFAADGGFANLDVKRVVILDLDVPAMTLQTLAGDDSRELPVVGSLVSGRQIPFPRGGIPGDGRLKKKLPVLRARPADSDARCEQCADLSQLTGPMQVGAV